MTIKTSFALLALVGALPLSAQVSTRERVRDRVIYGDGRTTARTGGGVGDIIFGRTGTATTSRTRIPPGQLPPRGMCRVWIDGVPPGKQPPVTSCAQAESDRLRYGVNAHVIYGDVQSFPGKGKGRYKTQNRQATNRQCSIWDVVVVGGQQRAVCGDGSVTRDRNGNVIRRRDENGRSGVVRKDDDDDRDEYEAGEHARGYGNSMKAHGKGQGKSHGKGKGHG